MTAGGVGGRGGAAGESGSCQEDNCDTGAFGNAGWGFGCGEVGGVGGVCGRGGAGCGRPYSLLEELL
jgi:hypothetical protein